MGLVIKNIDILSPKSFIGKTDDVIGKKVIRVWRRAKMLGIDLGSVTLLFHLKMTGQLILVGSSEFIVHGRKTNRLVGGHPTLDMMDKMPNSHTRVIFTFSDNSKLYFNDQRRFGWIKLIKGIGNRVQGIVFEKLGPEPLEKNFTWQILKENLLRRKSQPVKVALMDQSVVSGVGNIYSNEACFNAGIDPRNKSLELSDQQFKKLYVGLVKALRDGIKYGGSTRAHFVDPEGHRGYFLDYAYVYGLDKHPCKICKTEIKKVSLGGRGTYFCERCQK